MTTGDAGPPVIGARIAPVTRHIGLVPVAAGSVQIFGRSYDEQRNLVGYVPQRGSVDWDFPTNALDVVMMGRYGHMGLLLQLLLEFARDRHPDPDSGHGTSQGAVQGMRTLPLVSSYLAGQMAAGRLRRMDPDLAFQALAGPIVLHLLWRPRAAPRIGGLPAGGAPLDEAVDELVRVWLRAMATDQQAAPQPAVSTPTPPRSKRDDRPDTDQPPRGRP